MLKNYLKIAFRNLRRHKAYSLINISGLAIGMAFSALILLWVQNEWSYDRFNVHADHIYRVTCGAGDFTAAVNPPAMPRALQERLPEIKNTVRIKADPSTVLLETGDRKFEEKRAFYADSTFLEVFSYRLIEGNRKTAMDRPDAILMTEDMAKKYFGTTDALGKTLRKDNSSYVTVTGVLANVPGNSHLQFDFIMPISAIEQSDHDLRNNVWDNFNFFSYLLLDAHFDGKPSSLAKMDQQMDRVFREHVPESELKVNFHLQPLTRIHLHSNFQVDLPGHGNNQYVRIFFVVAIVILVVACINFMNLATARSARRAKEVGMRRAIGALRFQLIWQFLGESMLIAFFAMLLGFGILLSVLPIFNGLAGRQLPLHIIDGKLPLLLLGMALLTGLLSGSYPALYLSSFRPARVLKSGHEGGGGNRAFRNILVVLQFVVSIILLAGTIVVYRQLNFIQNRNLGFDKENLLYMPMKGDMWKRQDALKAKLQADPLTSNFAICNDLPIDLNSGTVDVKWEGKDPRSQVVFPTLDISEDFVRVFQMEMVSGRSFSTAFKGDSSNYIINEKAMHVMGFTPATAVGQPLTLWGTRGTIIGVVRDFNYKPIQHGIEPMIMRLNRYGGIVVIRVRPSKMAATVKALGAISHELNPLYPFSYDFLDQGLAKLYKGEERMSKLFNLFAILAIFISCMGLYGLSAFMAEQRTREIGVRKVLGASVFHIVYLLSKGFTRLIFIATLIAIPVAWLVIHSWLQEFAYHVQIGWIIFVIASVASLGIAWITVSFESVKAAFSNPVKTLRTE